MAFAKALLVNAHMTNIVQLASLKPTFNGSLNDRMHGFPTNVQQLGGFLHAGRSLQYPDCQRLKQQRESRVLPGPRYSDGLHSALLKS
jgi:hypothetical protein